MFRCLRGGWHDQAVAKSGRLLEPVGDEPPASADAYSGFLQDATKLTEKADASGFNVHSGISRVLSAYVLATLVDFFGDVPYSEALKGSDNFNPAADSGSDIYDAALALLDRAIVDFNTSAGVTAHPVTGVIPQAIPTNPPFSDLYYNGDITNYSHTL